MLKHGSEVRILSSPPIYLHQYSSRSRYMSAAHKLLISFVVILALLFFAVDTWICNKWVYHDFAAGIDRRLSCFWKSP
ncbi:MAG: hypothetical protein EBR64_04845 [Burkholderiaceae bacterium]|nr:hypothetical protein [Burkholderiaceae bacterium]